MHWPAVSMSAAHRRSSRAQRPSGGLGRTILRLHAYGLAAAVGQALLVEAGALDAWPLADVLWYTF
ncbi:hypothetical protein [Azospirillum sp. ST 5-10]|uniref:hypothetical protein n=1 Tax=unclassified Azospirillum TaxID=2630922 RepID=UPI003F4A1FE9